MDAQIEGHLPLITQRIIFAPKAFPPPPVITARIDFPAITVSHRDFTPPLTPDRDPKMANQRGATGATPGQEKAPNRQKGRVMFDDDMDIGPLSPLTENSGEETEDDGALNGKIKKPRGGPGRPASGGYKLQTELGWNDQTYESVVSLVHKLAKEKLDSSKSFRSQDKKELQRICERVTKEYSFLREYENSWPIRDILISRLKYTSESARRTEAQKKTKQMQKILTRSSNNISGSE